MEGFDVAAVLLMSAWVAFFFFMQLERQKFNLKVFEATRETACAIHGCMVKSAELSLRERSAKNGAANGAANVAQRGNGANGGRNCNDNDQP